MKQVRCRCGKLIGVSGTGIGAKFRCPACGSVFRVRASRRSQAVGDQAPDELDPGDTEGYELAESESATDSRDSNEAACGQRPPRASAPEPPVVLRPGTTFVAHHVGDASEDEEDAGPFLDAAAILYPWLYPTWIRWIGMSIMTELAVVATAITAFFLTVLMTFNAFGSLFTFGAMVTVCLGLWSYVISIFVMVLEDSANGDDRLGKLPGYAWYEILPPFLRTAGATLGSLGLAIGISYLLRDVLGEWYSPQRLLLVAIVVFVFFPVLMITNAVDQSFLPIYSLHLTCIRLVRRLGYFLLFLVMAGGLWGCVTVLLSLLTYCHIGIGVAAAGPVLAACLLYYGHWLGRLARQLSYAD